MKLIEYTTEISSRSDTVTLVPLGDIHLGSRNCDEELLKEEIDFIRRTPNCYWLGMGDYIEAIKARADRRMDFKGLAKWIHIEDLADIVAKQSDYFIRLVKPIKNKCMGLVVGNHEETVEKRDDQSVVDHMAVELGTRNLTYCTMIKWIIKRKIKTKTKAPSKIITIYANHGTGGGRYLGSHINKLVSMASGIDADIYLMGHCHRRNTDEESRLGIYGRGDNLRLLDNKKHFVLTGSFYRTYEITSTSYAEKKMYNPTSLGTMHIKIRAFKGKSSKDKDGQHNYNLPPDIRVSQ